MTNTTAAPKVATVVEKSDNAKTGMMSATYTGYQTCPDTCMMKPKIGPNGEFETSPCYASCDFVGITMHRITKAAVGADLIQIGKQECDGIDSLSGKNILRLKVGGDTPNTAYAEMLAKSCETYTAKHGQAAYTYTHNWANIERAAFGGISILASCDSITDIPVAKSRGYATATVVSEFPNGAKLFVIDGHKLVPCPNQVNKAVQCTDCKLCCNDSKLRKHDLTVAFVAHGRKADELAETQRGKGQ
jgi:hypothetical protein